MKSPNMEMSWHWEGKILLLAFRVFADLLFPQPMNAHKISLSRQTWKQHWKKVVTSWDFWKRSRRWNKINWREKIYLLTRYMNKILSSSKSKVFCVSSQKYCLNACISNVHDFISLRVGSKILQYNYCLPYLTSKSCIYFSFCPSWLSHIWSSYYCRDINSLTWDPLWFHLGPLGSLSFRFITLLCLVKIVLFSTRHWSVKMFRHILIYGDKILFLVGGQRCQKYWSLKISL